MKIKPILLLCLVLLPAAWAQQPSPNSTEWSADKAPSPYLDEAQFRWWAPEGLPKIRGILLFIPGRNGDARTAVDDSLWREIAVENDFALVGTRLFKPDGSYQLDPDGKTTATIEKAVAELGRANGHPEAAQAPLAFWGSSAGGNTANSFSRRNPRRVIAIVNVKCPDGHGGTDRSRTKIPILACVGKMDKPDWIKTSMEHYENAKQDRAAWTLALHPTEGHSVGQTKPLAAVFLKEVIPLRLGAAQAIGGGTSNLRTLSIQSGWLGNPLTLDVASASEFKGNKREAIWLPGPVTAEAWRTYLQTDSRDKH